MRTYTITNWLRDARWYVIRAWWISVLYYSDLLEAANESVVGSPCSRYSFMSCHRPKSLYSVMHCLLVLPIHPSSCLLSSTSLSSSSSLLPGNDDDDDGGDGLCVHMHRFHRLVYASVNRRSTLAGQATVQVQSMREMPEGAQKLNPWIFVQSTSKRVPSLLCSFVDYREICHFTAKISQTRGFNRL